MPNRNKKLLRSIGIFAIGCSLICFVMAYDIYRRQQSAGQAVIEALQNQSIDWRIDFESVTIPVQSVVSALGGLVLAVMGVRLIFESRKPDDPHDLIDPA